MLIGVLAKLKNGRLLQYRMREGGIPQVEAAKRAEVNHTAWNALENLRFRNVSWAQVQSIAALVGCDPYALCPTELKDCDARCARTAYHEASVNQLAAQETARRLELPSPSEVVADADLRDVRSARLKMALATLTQRERGVLELRYGLNGDPPQTLSEVGEVFQLHRERVRQIEAKAIRKLQHPVRLRLLEVGDDG